MNKKNSFFTGALSTLGFSEALGLQPEIVDPTQIIPVESVEAIISLIGGIASAVIIALLKRWWQKNDYKKQVSDFLKNPNQNNSP